MISDFIRLSKLLKIFPGQYFFLILLKIQFRTGFVLGISEINPSWGQCSITMAGTSTLVGELILLNFNVCGLYRNITIKDFIITGMN